MRRLYCALTALAVAASLHAQTDFSKVEVKASKVAGNIYMLTGAGGNIGVSVGEDGIVVIDDQYAPLAPKIESALKSITDKPVRFVVNTHYHGDHTGGNESFGGKSVPIVAQDNVRKRLIAGIDTPDYKVPPAPKAALPVLTFADSVTIHLNGEEIRAVHAPHAHTDGDSVIWFTGSNVVHMGDTFFNGRFPFIDTRSGGGLRGTIAVVNQVLTTAPADAQIIPGHGPLGDITALRNYRNMLEETSAVVAAGIKAGKSLSQLKEEKVLARWDSWGEGFIKTNDFIDTLYEELSPKK